MLYKTLLSYVSTLNTLAGIPLWWNKAEFNIPTCTLFVVIVVFVIPPFYSTIAVHFSSPVIVDYLYSPSYMY